MDTTGSLRQRRQQQTLRDISDVTLDLFAAQGFAETTVDEIAAAGVSTRTFHRYFPIKEDSVAPALDAGWQVYVNAFAARPETESVVDGLITALTETLDGPSARRHRKFLRSLPDSPVLAQAWLSVHDRCRSALQPVLAGRLALDPESSDAHLAASCVIAANRVAVETWAHQPRRPIAHTATACLTAISSLLTPNPRDPHTERRAR